MKTLIKNGTIVTAGDTYKADVLIEGEKIALIGQDLDNGGKNKIADEVIDASGFLLLPGGIDVHTHLDMPFGGTTTSDDFFTGQRGAAFGGTTTHIDFAIQSKGKSLRETIQVWQKKAEGKAVIDYGFHVAVTDAPPAVIDEIPSLLEEGVTSLKLFMAYKGSLQVDDATLYKAMEKAKEAGMLIMVHAENGDVIAELVQQHLKEGKTAPQYHATSRPSALEGEATGRAIALSGLTGAPLYVVHMSCIEAIEQLEIGRNKGFPVMGETCPQYMHLFEEDLARPGFEGAKFVCSPPVRKKKDAERLWHSLANGTLQVVSTDNCSFWFEGGKNGRQAGKELGKEGFHKIPNGMPGIEDRMYVLWTSGVNEGKISPNRFVEITSTNPAKIFGLYPRKGTIAPGSDADIILWDPLKEHTVSAKTQHVNTDYNPYEGMYVKGFPVRTILRGKSIVIGDEWKGEKGSGKFLHRNPSGDIL